MAKGIPVPPHTGFNAIAVQLTKIAVAGAGKAASGSKAFVAAANSTAIVAGKSAKILAVEGVKIGSTVASAVVCGSSKIVQGVRPIIGYAEKNPHIVIGLVALTSIPFLLSLTNTKIQKSAFLYRVVFVLTFLVNLVTVQIPGRIDSTVVKTTKNGKKVITYPWDSLFAPAGWAFIIWGVIYMGELLVTAQVAAFGKPVAALKKATVFWAAGNLFQSLWCFVFRPQFKEALWFPMLCLASASASLFVVHSEITKIIYPWSSIWEKVGLIALRSPISLHATWLTAAALLNLNGWASVAKTTIATQTSVAFFSAYLAVAAGGFFAVTRGDPLIALTVAWALAALSDRTLTDGTARVKKHQKNAAPMEVVEALALTEDTLSKVMIALGTKTCSSSYFSFPLNNPNPPFISPVSPGIGAPFIHRNLF